MNIFGNPNPHYIRYIIPCTQKSDFGCSPDLSVTNHKMLTLQKLSSLTFYLYMSVYRRLTVTGKFLDSKFTGGKCLTVNGGKFSLIWGQIWIFFLLLEEIFEAKFQVLVKRMHQKRNKKAFGSILVRNPNFDYFERKFSFF